MRDLQEARRIAATYPPEAIHTPRWEREAYLTETQQLAWLIRFDPERAAEVLSATDTPATETLRCDRLRHRAATNPDPHHG